MRNEIKLRFEEPEYIIDRQNGVVVCKLTYRANYPEIVSYTMGLMMPLFRTVKAVAKVGYDDTFDFEIGKRFPLQKQKRKHISKCLKHVHNKLNICIKLHYLLWNLHAKQML